jgi:hypothetical protein
MIYVQCPTQLNDVFAEIERGVYDSFPKLSKNVATYTYAYVIQYLKSVAKTWSGNFANSIKVLPNVSYSGFARYDIVCEAPYAMWLEFGHSAPEGLPYSNTGTRDYSKSKFKGYKMFETGINNMVDGGVMDMIAEKSIVESLNKIFGGSMATSAQDFNRPEDMGSIQLF